MAARAFHAVAYDIPDDKRRALLAKRLMRFGKRVQKSVFECFLKPEQYSAMCNCIAEIINPKADRVTLYPLCRACHSKAQTLGTGTVSKDEEVIII